MQIYFYAANGPNWLSLKYKKKDLQLISCWQLSSCHKKDHLRNLIVDCKSICMQKFSLIGWVWNSALFWQLNSYYELSNCQKKIDERNWLRDRKSNCMLKISLIGQVWNFALSWHLIGCFEQSSCHKKILTSQIDWGIANLTVCWKSVWLVKFEILPFFDSL